MIGVGSGIAPLRAILQEIHQNKWSPSGNAWLFFGCRDESENLFASETKKLAHCEVTFSRSSRFKKKYVQDTIIKKRLQIYQLVEEEGASVYVCGHTKMANDVKKSLVDVYINVANIKRDEAVSKINKMIKKGQLMMEYY